MSNIRIAPYGFFIKNYGLKRDVFGVMHRMRIWYNQQAKQAARPGQHQDLAAAARFDWAAQDMSDRIKEVEEFYA